MEQPINPVAAQVKPPAIGLIVVGVINLLLGLMAVLSLLLRLTGRSVQPTLIADGSAAYRTGQVMAQLVFIISLVVAPFVIKGAVDMLRGRKYSSAKMAAILAMIPMTSCCFLLGAPFGIWALIVLSKPEVKTFFETGRDDFSPPPPPQYP